MDVWDGGTWHRQRAEMSLIGSEILGVEVKYSVQSQTNGV